MKYPEFRQRNRARRFSFFTWFKLGVLSSLFLAAGSLFTPYPAELVRQLKSGGEQVDKAAEKAEDKADDKVDKPKKVRRKRVRRAEVQPAPEPAASAAATSSPELVQEATPEPWSPQDCFEMPQIVLPPFPPALPERVATGEFEHLNTLVNGINLKSTAHFKTGSTASQDRSKPQSYVVQVGLELFQPHAADGRELLHANPKLPQVLARYDDLMSTAKVSPWFHALYRHKQNRIRKNASQVEKLLDRHNFYDTDTMLEISSPSTGRKLLWLQADMDVVSDGSDGDRLPEMPEKIRKSDYYQPSTSYRWKKRSKTVNPLLPGWQERLKKLQQSKGSKDAIEHAKRTIADLKTYSFLLAEYDPFIVAPLVFKEGPDRGFSPSAGDYAVVIVGDRVFPAIVGDFGPNFKTGEASLRLCKLVNPKAQIYARPVSDLGVSYLYFPGSKEAVNGPIDYERLHSRCLELLAEFGGLGPEAQFQKVPDLLAPPAPPSPPAPAAPAAPAPPAEPAASEAPASPEAPAAQGTPGSESGESTADKPAGESAA